MRRPREADWTQARLEKLMDQICCGCKKFLGSEGIKVWDPADPPGHYLYFCSRECADEHKPPGGVYIEAVRPE